jgi:hypothetical protein
MANALTTLRGQDSRYFYQRSDTGRTGYNYPENGVTDETNGKEGSDSLLATSSVIINALYAATFWTVTDEDTEESTCLTYNPIIDQFKINEGEYVL